MDKWMITEIEIVSPPDAQFMPLFPETDGDHTYCRRSPNHGPAACRSQSVPDREFVGKRCQYLCSARLSRNQIPDRSSARVILNDARSHRAYWL